MKRLLVLAATGVLAGSAFSSPTAHGGTYRGPGGTIPPAAGGSAGTPSPSTADPTGDVTSWAQWWSFNRDGYLNLKSAVQRGDPVTTGKDYYLGRGQQDGVDSRLRPSRIALEQKVVPALIAAVRNESSVDIQGAALIALAKIGVEPAQGEGATATTLVEVIGPFLADANQELAESAALALGILADERSVFVLADLLADSVAGRRARRANQVDLRTRAFAAFGLGLVGSRTQKEDVRRFCVSRLAAALELGGSASHDLPVACAISLGLVPLSVAPEQPADDVERPASSSRQAQLAFVLAAFEDREQHGFLVRSHLALAAARLSGGLAPPWKERVAGALIQSLSLSAKPERELQQACALALGLVGDDDADEIDARIRARLIQLLDEGDQLARYQALVSLAYVAARPGEGQEPGSAVGSVRKLLFARVNRGTSISRPWAGLALAILEQRRRANGAGTSPDTRTALGRALENARSPDERGGLCTALGILGDPGASPALRALLSTSDDDRVRGFAAVGLGLMGAEAAREDLRAIVKSARFRPVLLKECAIALALLGDKQLVPELIGMLRQAGSLSSQVAIASALGFIGDARSVEPLIDLLEDEGSTDLARAFAAVALGITCERSALPWNHVLAADVAYGASTQTMIGFGRGVLEIL